MHLFITECLDCMGISSVIEVFFFQNVQIMLVFQVELYEVN
jgi:hypothetical protein